MEDDNVRLKGRRDLIKLGAGVVASALMGQRASAQGEGQFRTGSCSAAGFAASAGEWRPHTGPGYQYTSNRLGANGPMDDTTRKIVKFVNGYNESDITPTVIKAVNRTMVDSMAALMSGFEEEAVRIAARTARLYPAVLKSTVLGYGMTTPPEMAAFVNSCMVRLVDFNDTPHDSNLFPAALAIGEALHSTGPQVMAAVVMGYEIHAFRAPGKPLHLRWPSASSWGLMKIGWPMPSRLHLPLTSR